MLTIQIRLMCPGNGGEILPTELEKAELLVEELVSQVLLELFGVVIVEKVKISFLEEEGWWHDTFSEAS
jgi:hypothetical protein